MATGFAAIDHVEATSLTLNMHLYAHSPRPWMSVTSGPVTIAALGFVNESRAMAGRLG